MPITSLSFYRARSFRDALWYFRQMVEARPALAAVNGLTFHRLLGTGRGDGFSPWPDTRDVGLLQVWQDRSAAEAYFGTHDLEAAFMERATERYRLWLNAEHGHGRWAGREPFVYSGLQRTEGPVAVITRATIRTGALLRFWRSVPAIRGTLSKAPGLLLAEGIGEWPFVQQATFSVWNDVADMRAFAYGSAHHQQAVRDTRRHRLFSEELFARFAISAVEGSWNGGDPLASLGLATVG